MRTMDRNAFPGGAVISAGAAYTSTETGPMIITFGSGAHGMTVWGWDEDGKAITHAEASIDANILRRIVRLSPDGMRLVAAIRAVLAAWRAS